MGLIVQAPADSLLPVADPAMTPAGQAPDDAPAGDAFAGLLAALSANLDADPAATAVGDPVEIPVGDIAPSADEKKEESNPFAALMAMTVPLAISTPVLVTAEATGTAVGGVEATSAADQPAEFDPATPGAAGDLATAVTEELPATETPVASPAPATEAMPAADVLPNVVPVATSDTKAISEAPVSGPATEATTSMGAPDVDNTPEPGESPQLKRGQPPTEADGAQPEQTQTTSVVRSVGNAETESNTDKQDAHSERGRLRGIDRPQPRASAEGIAHAAPHSAAGELRQANDAAPVDAPTAVDQPVDVPEVPQQVDQVAKAVIERVETGGGEARIHLHPVELGEVTIRVHTDGDAVRVAIHAERREAMNILRDHTQDLSTLLGERGLNLSDVNVGFGRGNGSQTWGDEQRPQNRPVAGAFASVMGIDQDVPIERHQRLRAAYNPDGAHFFRV
ncbi:MAG: flagellar hook-length control protein FliK [Dehalococcoidia bacterium]